MSRRVLLDIDEVLSYYEFDKIEQVAFFEKYGAIITAVRTHYVFPGVIELIKALFDEPDVEVGFYSSGPQERNEPYVEQLLRKALGDARYLAVKANVLILNKLVDFPAEEKKQEFELYKKHTISKHKDLKEACKNGSKVEDCLLVDDTFGCAAVGQIKNMLVVPHTDHNSYYKSHSYDEEGYQPLEFMTFDGELNPRFMDKYLSGQTMIVVKKPDSVTVHFLDKDTREAKSRVLENQQLALAIQQWKDFYLIDPIDTQLRALVESWNGVTKQLCREFNRIYYVAGMLFKTLREAKASNQPVSEVLFKRTFREISAAKFEPLHSILAENDEYYDLGLEILRKYNKDLKFMSPHLYNRALQVEITPELKEKYENYLNYGKKTPKFVPAVT